MRKHFEADPCETNRLLEALRLSALQRGLSDFDADEVVADTYYSALMRPSAQRMEVRSLPALLKKMHGWSITDFVRKKRREQSRLSAAEADLFARRSMIGDVRYGEHMCDLRKALATLPFSEREAVWLIVGKGYTAQMIATKRGVTERAVCARKNRGLAKLRRFFGIDDV